MSRPSRMACSDKTGQVDSILRQVDEERLLLRGRIVQCQQQGRVAHRACDLAPVVRHVFDGRVEVEEEGVDPRAPEVALVLLKGRWRRRRAQPGQKLAAEIPRAIYG